MNEGSLRRCACSPGWPRPRKPATSCPGCRPRSARPWRRAPSGGTARSSRAVPTSRGYSARLPRDPCPRLSPEEQAFLDGPVEQVCGMVDEWELNRRREFPPEVLPFLREHGFFGLVIPREYGRSEER